MALTPFLLFLKLSFFLPMVFLIIRHYIGRLMEAIMGRRGLTSAVQTRKLCRAYLLRAGGSSKTTAMLHPAVFTGAAGGWQEALGHSASLMRRWEGFSVTYPLQLQRGKEIITTTETQKHHAHTKHCNKLAFTNQKYFSSNPFNDTHSLYHLKLHSMHISVLSGKHWDLQVLEK